jgi:hypothetical protein
MTASRETTPTRCIGGWNAADREWRTPTRSQHNRRERAYYPSRAAGRANRVPAWDDIDYEPISRLKFASGHSPPGRACIRFGHVS